MTSFAQAPEKEARTVRWLPLIVAIAAVTTATPLAWDKSLARRFPLDRLFPSAVPIFPRRLATSQREEKLLEL